VQQATVWAVPADQRLCPDEVACVGIVLRLVVANQGVSLHRVQEVAARVRDCRGLLLKGGVIGLRAAASVAFGSVQGGVGVCEDFVGICGSTLPEGVADAKADGAVFAFECHRFADLADDGFAHADQQRFAWGLREQNRKFVTTDAEYLPKGAEGRGEVRGHRLQNEVPSEMAEGVIDLFEVIQIHQHDAVTVCLGHRVEKLFRHLVKTSPVSQSSQDIVARVMFELVSCLLELFGALVVFGHVDVDADKAARPVTGLNVARKAADVPRFTVW